ncbi:MAG: hypothetical protein CR971_00920 [candidate division SR1 bacterium]|nr:MAG: hypothetical protein CR971_00920 [candidate division SR1 bacterium]
MCTKTKKLEKKPSDFSKIRPWSSIFQNVECETIALNIVGILARTGDEWRELKWEEYKEEREKEGVSLSSKHEYFEAISEYCSTYKTARLFSPDWKI